MGCENSFISASSKHFAAVLSDEPSNNKTNSEYDRYQRFAAEEFVLQSGGALCPQPNCGTGIMPHEEENADSNSIDEISLNQRKIVCTECRYVFCRFCLQGYHVGDCDEMQTNHVMEDGARGDLVPSSTMNLVTDQNLVSRARWAPEEMRTNIDEHDDISGSMSSWVAIRVTTKPCPKVCPMLKYL